MLFQDRFEAGRVLASRLRQFANRTDVIVLGLARGGIPVGFEVAKALNAPLDVFVVRKLGVPGREEVAWQDRNGRFGIRFLDTPQASRRALKEWVSANAHKGEANPYALGRAALPQG